MPPCAPVYRLFSLSVLCLPFWWVGLRSASLVLQLTRYDCPARAKLARRTSTTFQRTALTTTTARLKERQTAIECDCLSFRESPTSQALADTLAMSRGSWKSGFSRVQVAMSYRRIPGSSSTSRYLYPTVRLCPLGAHHHKQQLSPY